MLGVNQTIMMALGIVVIAAFVGAGGLGQTVLHGLQQLNVGRALDGGVAIVVMAIVLDRVTTAWSKRDPRARKPLRLGAWSLGRRAVLILALAASLGAIVIGRQVLVQQEFPERWTVSLRAARERDRRLVPAELPRGGKRDERRTDRVAARSARRTAHRCAVVDGRRRVRADRAPAVRMALGARRVRVHHRAGPPRHVGRVDGHARVGARGGRDHHRVRDPARGRRRSQRSFRAMVTRRARRDADDARVRVPGAGAAAVRAWAGAGDHRLVHLRPARWGPADEPGDPPGADGHGRGGRLVRVDVMAAPAQGAAAARPRPRSCSA